MTPSETQGIERHSPIVWSSTEDEPAFVFDITHSEPPFVCFFLQAMNGAVAPKVSFDQGQGFNELSSLVFRAFPLGFYHISLATMGNVRRIRFRPSEGPSTFRFLAFRTHRSLGVAVLHYLFNLRYQKIGLVTPTPNGLRGSLAMLTSNVARIRKFFADVSVGSGVRVQQADDDVLARLKLAQSLQAVAVQGEMRERLAHRAAEPLISFVAPTYNTQSDYLRDLLDSFSAEEAPYAELLLSDDGSTSSVTAAALKQAEAVPGVRVLRNPKNQGIAPATNAGIAAARGDWVGFIDHDDAFVSGAIAVIAKAILDHPEADFFYTDEIITNGALKPIGSFCKPGYDSVLLSGQNFINHFSVFRRTKLRALGGLRLDREGSQDYDLLLRYISDPRPGSIVHIPFLAYMWRRPEQSYSALYRERSVSNARSALRLAYETAGREVVIEPATNPDFHRVRFPAAGKPLVSVIIPNRDSLALISRIVADLRERTAYDALEIIVVDNGSTDDHVLRFYEEQGRAGGFKTEIVSEPFNFARMCNRGARLARGDAFLFLNNDIEVGDAGWLAEMVECLAFADTGIVGARLLYPNGKLQHAGVIVGLGDAAGHWYVGDGADEPGPMGRLAVRQTLTAVTAACMLVTRTCFTALGGFDEHAFAIAYNDVDLCIRSRQAGFRTVWTPFATLIHHESVSRGSDETIENNPRFLAEMGRLRERHHTATIIDESFSPFYDRRYSQPHLAMTGALPEARPNTLR